MNSVIFLPFFRLVGENQHPLQAAAVTAEFNPCFPGSLLIHLGRLVAVGSCTSTTTYCHYGWSPDLHTVQACCTVNLGVL